MLLGTVGVLVVCRLALAALLIIGPVFIVLALFEGTRGLFEGWLKSVVMFALVPLLTVVMGSGALVAIAPMVAGLDQGGAEVPLRTAVSILVAEPHCASLDRLQDDFPFGGDSDNAGPVKPAPSP